MTIRTSLRTALGALALGSVLAAAAGPVAAKPHDPGLGSVIGGGFFRGLPLGPQSAATPQSRLESTGMADEKACYLVPSRVADERGVVTVRLVRVCE